MFELNKQYKTTEGRPARCICVDLMGTHFNYIFLVSHEITSATGNTVAYEVITRTNSEGMAFSMMQDIAQPEFNITK